MIRFDRFALAAATLAGLATALPATADVGRASQPLHTVAVQLDGNACARSLAAVGCSSYQTRLLAAAAAKATGKDRGAMEVVGRRQLDALIASIN